MACNITINPTIRRTTLAGVIGIQVEGTSAECGKVKVEIRCGQDSASPVTTAPDASGHWTAFFPGERCACNKPIHVNAKCVDQGNCNTSFDGILVCDPRSGCPIAQVTTKLGECDESGKRVVEFTVTVTNTQGNAVVVTQINFGDGNFSAASATSPYTVSHSYEVPSIAQPSLAITFPEGCANIPVILPSLPPCFACPTAQNITIIPGACDNDGKRQFLLTIPTVGSGIQISTVIDYGDGTTSGALSVAAGDTLLLNHSYSTGQSYTITISMGACAPIQIATNLVENCSSTPPPPPTGGGEDGLCLGFRWAFVILTILAAISTLISLCIPAVSTLFIGLSIGFAVGAAIMFGLWRLFSCPEPCGWGYLMAWQIAIGTGLGAMYFKDCCPWMFWTAIVSLASGLGLLFTWVIKCKRTACQVSAEFSVIITSVAAPAIGWLAYLDCGSAIIQNIILTISGLIALSVGYCLKINRPDGPVVNQTTARRIQKDKDCGCS